MMGITRGFSTLVGAAVAGFLIWLAVQLGSESEAEYWGAYGLIAAAGLTMALSQIAGGWTKWGRPRISPGVFVLGFLPVLVVGGWVLLARQPADFFNTSNWSRDLGIMGPVGDLGEALAAIAFLIGLTFGLTFDTAGVRRGATDQRHRVASESAAYPPPRVHRERDEEHVRTPETAPTARARDHADGSGDRVHDADEPLTAERREHAHEAEPEHRGRRFGFRRRVGSGGREET